MPKDDLIWRRRDLHRAVSTTRGQTNSTKGINWALEDIQFERGGLPVESNELRALAAATPSEWREAWPHIDAHFPVAGDGQRHNLDIDHDRQEAFDLREKRRAAAQKANAKRWKREREKREALEREVAELREALATESVCDPQNSTVQSLLTVSSQKVAGFPGVDR